MSDDHSFEQPHDTLFHYVFERPEIAEGELRSVLPEHVVDAIDFSTLKLEASRHVDIDGSTRQSDLVYRVVLSGRDAFVFILFEHQSESDPAMPLRMARYMWRLWERWLRTNEEATRLPVIIPLVLHNGLRPWSAPRRLSALYDAPESVVSALGPHLMDVELRIDDLPAQHPNDIRQRTKLHVLGRLALFAMQRARTAPDFVGELAEWYDLAEQILTSDQGLEDWSLIIRYIEHTSDAPIEALQRSVARRFGRQVEERMATIAERLRAEGRAQAKQRAEAEILLKQVRLKFGEPDGLIRARIENASQAELDGWVERVLFASSIEELLR